MHRPNPSGRFCGPSSPVQSRTQKLNANFYFHPLQMQVVPVRRDEAGEKWLLELGAPSFPNFKWDQSRGSRSFYSVGGSQGCHSTQRLMRGEILWGDSTWHRKHVGGGQFGLERCRSVRLRKVCRQMWRLDWMSAALLHLMNGN